jgi:hypothetical protein
VLAHLLRGESLTGLDAVRECGTTRAAAHIHWLREGLGWPIVTDERAYVCADGRVVQIAVYRLPAAAIEQARAAGGEAWLTNVDAARAAQRAKRQEAEQRAARMNAERLHTSGSLA